MTPSNTTNNNNSPSHLGIALRTKNQQQSSLPSCSLSSSCWLTTIRRLNNHGCVLLMKGNFAEANCVFKEAITNHEQYVTSSTASSSAPSAFRRCHCHDYDNIESQNSDTSDISSDHTSTVNFSDAIEDTTMHFPMQGQSATTPITTAPFSHDLSDEKEDDQISSDYNETRTAIATATDVTFEDGISSNFVEEEEASSSSLSLLGMRGDNAATTSLPLRRMTMDSQLRISSRYGQQPRYHYHDHLQFQQVYSQPIVMKEEWIVSTIENKSFALIYNTALCNHLWGMNLLVTIRDYNQDQEVGNNNDNSNNVNSLSSTCKRRFHIAKNLYRLALENVHLFENGADQLFYVAMFNNMSHVLKTLQGYNSQEVYHFDMLLLKAINWWKETNPSSRNNNNSGSSLNPPSLTHAVIVAQQQDELRNNASNSSSFISSNSNSGTNLYTDTDANTNSSSYYHDGNLEIIDSFLDNVFYLVGVPNALLLAPAA